MNVKHKKHSNTVLTNKLSESPGRLLRQNIRQAPPINLSDTTADSTPADLWNRNDFSPHVCGAIITRVLEQNEIEILRSKVIKQEAAPARFRWQEGNVIFSRELSEMEEEWRLDVDALVDSRIVPLSAFLFAVTASLHADFGCLWKMGFC